MPISGCMPVRAAYLKYCATFAELRCARIFVRPKGVSI
jgi:hypothetical protein